MPSMRVEQALEQLSEDGTLTGDLDDVAGTALLQWAEQQVVDADGADDPAAFEARVAAVRSAVRSAARATSRSLEPVSPAAVVTCAADLLSRSGVGPSTALPSTGTVDGGKSPVAVPAAEPSAAAQTAGSEAEPAAQPSGSQGVTAAALENAAVPPSGRRSVWETVRRRLRRWMHRKAS